jgi:hypothetical protein
VIFVLNLQFLFLPIHHKTPEADYLIQISLWLKNNTKIDYKIIYINSLKNKIYDEENKILYLSDNLSTYNYPTVDITIANLLEQNREIMNKYFNIESQNKEILEDQNKEILEDQNKDILEDQNKDILKDQNKEILEDQNKDILEDQNK